jgi:hypothetical protein
MNTEETFRWAFSGLAGLGVLPRLAEPALTEPTQGAKAAAG